MTRKISIIFTISILLGVLGTIYLKSIYEIDDFNKDNVNSLLESVMTPEYIMQNIQKSLDNGDLDLAKQYLSLADSLELRFDSDLGDTIKNEEGAFNSIYRNSKDFGKGFVLGEGDSSASIIGSVSSDFTVVGDIRDLSSETLNYINGAPVDTIVAGLSVVGIALTAGTVVSLGSASEATFPGKLATSLLKISVKTGNLSKKLISSLKEMLNKSVNLDPIFNKIYDIKGFDNLNPEKWADVYNISKNNIKLDKINHVLDNLTRIKNNSGGISDALHIIKYADSTKDITKLRKLTKYYGNRSLAVLKILGKKSIKAIKMSFKKLAMIFSAIASFLYLILSLFSSFVIKKILFRFLFNMRNNYSLKDAYKNKKSPKGPGVYKIIYKDKLMKVGKASDGLRKRFSDYYRGESGGTAGLKYITNENRDYVYVNWSECPVEECRDNEIKLYEQAKKMGEELLWSDRR